MKIELSNKDILGRKTTSTYRFPVEFFFTGWMLMLLLGILHIDFIHSVPAVGYWPCVALCLVVQLLVAWSRSDK